MRQIGMMTKMHGKARVFLSRASPMILSTIAACGVITTAVVAAKDTPKAIKLLEKAQKEKEDDLTKTEKMRIILPAYFPTIMIVGGTIGCIFGAHALNKKQQASIMSAYALLDNSFREYRKKVAERYGDGEDLSIRSEIVKEKRESLVRNNSSEVMFFEEYSNRFFWRTMEEVIDAEYHFNRNLALRGYAELNELYEFLGLEPTEYGSTMGWSLGAEQDYGYSWVDFRHELHEDNDPDTPSYYYIYMPFPPHQDFMDY